MSVFLVCDDCKNFTPEECEEFGACSTCGASLLPRAKAKRAMTFKRSPAHTAFAMEDEYSRSLFVPGDPLVQDAWQLLDYVAGQLRVIQAIVDLAADDWSKVGVVGFLTGSLDLLWLLRERIGFKLPQRVRITRGLAHKNTGENEADESLAAILDEYATLGVTKLAIVDEVVGGGQMRAGRKRVRRWLRRNGNPGWTIAALGMTDEPPESQERAHKIITDDGRLAWATLTLIAVPALLAKDEAGVPVKTVMRFGSTKYMPYRYWPGSYEVRCANTLTDCSFRVVAAGNMSEAYSSTIRSICTENPNRPKAQLPEKACAACKERLAQIREIAKRFPKADQEGVVVGRVSDRRALIRP